MGYRAGAFPQTASHSTPIPGFFVDPIHFIKDIDEFAQPRHFIPERRIAPSGHAEGAIRCFAIGVSVCDFSVGFGCRAAVEHRLVDG